MTEDTKNRLRLAWRGFEALIAIALLAVLAELVLIMVNSPTPAPEIRFIRQSVPAEPLTEATPLTPQTPAPQAQEIKMAQDHKAPKKDPVIPAPEAQPDHRQGRTIQPAPAPTANTPALLDFANLKKVVGFGSSTHATSGGGNDTPKTVVVTSVVVSGTNAAASGSQTNALISTNAPTSGTQTNSNPSSSNTSTNNAGPVFRLVIP